MSTPALPAVRPKPTAPARVGAVRAAAVILLVSGITAVASLVFLWLATLTPPTPNVEFGTSFGYVIFSIGLSVIWWVFAVIGFVVLWLSGPRSARNIPFLAVALGFAGIAIQVDTNEPIRDVIAYAALGLLGVGSVAGVGMLAWRRPFRLVADILLAAFLLSLAYNTFIDFGTVGSRYSTTIGSGPSVIPGCVLLLAAVALLIWPRTRSKATE